MYNGTPLYLRPNVQIEPLIDQWYAWAHLIPPAGAARNLTERHLKIMESYINAPQVHANAVKNPKLLGGPFIDYGGTRVDEIRNLRDSTRRVRAGLIQFSNALTALDTLLRENAKGHSLQPLYPNVPQPLRGYVELVYDLNNHASFRLLEPLLYRSEYYVRDAQSLMLSVVTGDDRPFVLSTPRLETPGLLHLRKPFDSRAVEGLLALKTAPMRFPDVREILEIEDEHEAELLGTFLTPAPPRPYQKYEGKGVRWRYFGHACILIEAEGKSMLFDPVLSYTYESSVSRYTYEDLPEHIDMVLITHNHQDHVLFETLLQLRSRIGTLVIPRNNAGALQDPSLKLLLAKLQFQNVVELSDFDSIPFAGGSVLALPFFGEHSDLDVRSKLAYLVEIKGHTLMFAADSCNIEPALYEHVHKAVGAVDVLFLGMECDGAPLSWLYGPLLTQRIERSMDESRRLSGSNYEQASDMATRFQCRELYVYAMGQEPWLNHVMSLKYTPESRPITESNRLIEECRSRGMVAERLFGEREILIN